MKTIFEELKLGLEEAIAHQKGKIHLQTETIEVPETKISPIIMKYKSYKSIVTFDEEAKLFHGEVMGIKDVITFQGTSISELEKAFKDSVDDYIAWCKERGEQSELIMKRVIDYQENLIKLLKNPKKAIAYLNAALMDKDERIFLLALKNVLEAQGCDMTSLAREADLSRENLYRILSKELYGEIQKDTKKD